MPDETSAETTADLPEEIRAALMRALREVFGYDSLRPGQEAALARVMRDQNLLAVMPTGAGKSICYQLPAVVRGGLTVVVSPLIALMRDQVAALRAAGVEAGSLNSASDPAERERVLAALAEGRLRLLYLSPERLGGAETMRLLERSDVRLLAIDEAHCVSQWGHDFRPEYTRLGAVRARLGGPPTIALTATADRATREDIAAQLFESPPDILVMGFDRPNLRLAMRPKANPRRQIEQFLALHRGASGIVYCNSRRQTEELSVDLAGRGVDAHAYHAGMEKEAREAVQDRFLASDGVVIFATVAFGMGIDKPDVRFVAHAGLPKSVEAYYQEIGRAGRDGLPADTLTLYGIDDIRLRRRQIDESEAPEERKRVDRQRLNALVALCEAPRCRRQTLLAYFGETDAAPCGNCDLCLDGVETMDGTIEAQKALSAILRTGERFGMEHLIDLLRGEATEKIERFGHDKLPTFGVGADRTKVQWRGIFRQLYALGIAGFEPADHGAWRVGPNGRAVLKDGEAVRLRLEPTRRSERARGGTRDLPEGVDTDLLARLKEKRLAIARHEGVPAYVVFPDRTLIEIAADRPADRAALARVHGVGSRKLERYGDAFLGVLREGTG
ncbi:DNA helicase RecQ [Marivibrio halodurans]|uniref:DNA helicase RecQ n=1 Tax=Marivibrio halodurans TaxID=2039722 RepID=A0A8J7S8D3_9PROT|nr:DNA helicase RecQ [Marivibrio halodurans]MBP5858759.1 DNA helicase RecQ [Marivibrio halodurans]